MRQTSASAAAAVPSPPRPIEDVVAAYSQGII